MKVRHFHHQHFNNLYQLSAVDDPPALLVNLRHGKIIINTLLRWCSAGLIAAYILTITATINLYNQLSLSTPWLSNIALALFIVLFMVWLYVQYHYSEKRAESKSDTCGEIQLNAFYVKDHYKTNHRLIGIYLSVVLAAWILMTAVLFAHLQMPLTLLPVLSILFYSFGLCMIGILLKEKCMIRQMINKFGHQ
jgi:hypothetical protein